MAREQYANDPVSTLNGTINNSVTSLVVASASSFPSTGNFRLIIDSEIMKVTAVSGTTFTVARGQEGTTAVSHTNGVNVFGILTKASWDAMRADNVFLDTFANRPTAELTGRLAIEQDGLALARDNGSTWDLFAPIQKIVPPIDANYAWVNQGSATIVATGSALYLSNPPDNASLSFHIRKKAVPGSTPYSVTIGFMTDIQAVQSMDVGFILRNSGNGKIVSFTLQYNSAVTTFALILALFKLDSATVFNATYTTMNVWPRNIFWLKFRDDGVNRNFYYSADGKNWVLFSQHGRTDFITADEWGFYVDPSNLLFPIGMTLIHWEEGN